MQLRFHFPLLFLDREVKLNRVENYIGMYYCVYIYILENYFALSFLLVSWKKHRGNGFVRAIRNFIFCIWIEFVKRIDSFVYVLLHVDVICNCSIQFNLV